MRGINAADQSRISDDPAGRAMTGPALLVVRGSDGAAHFRAIASVVVLAFALACFVPSSVLAAPLSGDDPAAKDDAGPPARKSKSKSKSKKPPAASTGKAPKKKTGGKVDMTAVPVDEKAEKQAIAALGDLAENFKIKRTLHFSVLYDTSDEDVGAFTAAIEKTYRSCARFSDKLGVKVKPPKHKLIIYYFNELADYSAHSEKHGYGKRTENTPGFYAPNINWSYFYNFRNSATFKRMRADAEDKISRLGEQVRRGGLSAAERKRISAEIKQARAVLTRMRGLGGDVSEQTVQHEVAHQVLWNIGFHNAKQFNANPRWFAEGMAQLFEPVSTGKAANIGLVNQSRLRGFRQLVKAGKLVPLRDFVSTPAYFNHPEVAYPQSWALLHYLARVKGKQLKEFVRLVNKRPKDYQSTPEEEIATFERAFGKTDDQWIANWLRWMEKVR